MARRSRSRIPASGSGYLGRCGGNAKRTSRWRAQLATSRHLRRRASRGAGTWDYERLASEDLTPHQRETLLAHAERCSLCAHRITREDAASATEPGHSSIQRCRGARVAHMRRRDGPRAAPAPMRAAPLSGGRRHRRYSQASLPQMRPTPQGLGPGVAIGFPSSMRPALPGRNRAAAHSRHPPRAGLQ